MLDVKIILDNLKIPYNIESKSDVTTFTIDDIGGQITIMDDNAYFIHGNSEPSIPLKHPFLSKWVKAYTESFEDFEEILEKTKI
jgi:hypothetical protein